jgi:hypothetical protein
MAMLDERLRSGSTSVVADRVWDARRQAEHVCFQDDAVVDHVTGESMQASKVMKGGLSILWQ